MAVRGKLNRKQKRERIRKIPWTIFAALIYSVFYIPVLVMILFSFNDSKRNYSWVGFTTKWYPKLFSFGNHDLWESLVYSLIIAVVVTVISVIIGVLGGIGLKKYEFRGKKFINMMLFVPIVVPEIVMAVSMLIIFMVVGFKLGMGTIVMGHCTFCIPYTVIIIKGRITGDNETLQEASMDLGANRLQTFFYVTIPSIMPGIMSAAFLSFTLSIDDVMISNMLAGASQSTLPVLILSVNRTGITPDINALTTIMVMVMIFGMMVMNVLQRIHNKREAKILAESDKRIHAARLAAGE
ncbi:MAG: ABC transporter permease [Eubacterium sp.]|nr:ABC transporter permease [Eubacterium sp.]